MHSIHPETKTAGIQKLEMQAELLNCFFFESLLSFRVVD